MTSEIGFEAAHICGIPMRTRFRGITVREGMLLRGPAGWGEFCPFADYDDRDRVVHRRLARAGPRPRSAA